MNQSEIQEIKYDFVLKKTVPYPDNQPAAEEISNIDLKGEIEGKKINDKINLEGILNIEIFYLSNNKPYTLTAEVTVNDEILFSIPEFEIKAFKPEIEKIYYEINENGIDLEVLAGAALSYLANEPEVKGTLPVKPDPEEDLQEAKPVVLKKAEEKTVKDKPKYELLHKSRRPVVNSEKKIKSISSSAFKIYIVKENDNLDSIAGKYNLTPDDLKRINKLTSSWVVPGQVLMVPVMSGK